MNAFEKIAKFLQTPSRVLRAVNALRERYAQITHEQYGKYEPIDLPDATVLDRADSGISAAEFLALLRGMVGTVQEFFSNTGPLLAALHAAEIRALDQSGGNIAEDAFIASLEDTASSPFDLTNTSMVMAMIEAHLGWQAVQPARDILKAPLGRMTRTINAPFALLLNEQVPEKRQNAIEEMKKDYELVRLGAEILLDVVNQ